MLLVSGPRLELQGSETALSDRTFPKDENVLNLHCPYTPILPSARISVSPVEKWNFEP